jgi:arsenate reductase (thioredoxin)
MQATGRKINILYLCTGNSCRSQMAEGYTNALKSETIQAYSAGVKAQERVDPLAIAVMKEDGVDISSHRPKTLDELKGIHFDYVVTVCDNANENCPLFPGGTRKVQRSFDDPPRLTDGMKPEEAMMVYRRVRDEIKIFIQSLPQDLK